MATPFFSDGLVCLGLGGILGFLVGGEIGFSGIGSNLGWSLGMVGVGFSEEG